MSAVAAFGATAPSTARVGARSDAAVKWDRRGGARALPRAVARSAAADVEAMASVSDAETGAADDDDGSCTWATSTSSLEGTIETAVRDALGEALRDRVRSMAVPGWRDKRLADGTEPRSGRGQAQSRVGGAGVCGGDLGGAARRAERCRFRLARCARARACARMRGAKSRPGKAGGRAARRAARAWPTHTTAWRRKKVRNAEELEEALRNLLTSPAVGAVAIVERERHERRVDANDEETSSSSVSPAAVVGQRAWRVAGASMQRWRPQRARWGSWTGTRARRPWTRPGATGKGYGARSPKTVTGGIVPRGSRRRESRRDGGARRARAPFIGRERDDG